MLVRLLLPLFVAALAAQAHPFQGVTKPSSPVQKRAPLNDPKSARLNRPIAASFGNAKMQMAFGKRSLPVEGRPRDPLRRAHRGGSNDRESNESDTSSERQGIIRIGASGIAANGPTGGGVEAERPGQQGTPGSGPLLMHRSSERMKPYGDKPSNRRPSSRVSGANPSLQVSINQGQGHGLHKRRSDVQTKRAVRVQDFKNGEVDKDSSGDKQPVLHA